MNDYIARWHKSISEIPKNSWKDLLGDHQNPFFDWDWLYALENSEAFLLNMAGSLFI